MKPAKLITLLAIPFMLTLTTQAEAPKQEPKAADFGDPPPSILEHYKWCLAKEDIAAQTVLLRAFWKDHCPPEGDYEDSIHGRMVLLSAYRLAENYSRMNRPDDAVIFINWIRSEDTRLIEEERKPDQDDGDSKP